MMQYIYIYKNDAIYIYIKMMQYTYKKYIYAIYIYKKCIGNE